MGDMRLFAAIVPPPEVLDELESLVRSVVPRTRSWRPRLEHAVPDGHHAAARKGVIGRLTGHGGRGAAVLPPQTDQLTRLAAARMHIPITTFGNLTGVDTKLLARELREAVATWQRPELCLTGGAALHFPGDKAVWVRLGGQVDELHAMATEIPKLVQRLSLFVDRRSYRPMLSVGTITDTTTGPYLEQLVAALEGFQGMTWTQDTISLMHGQPDAGRDEPFEELERMPLAVG
jgi:2'-5' RNA ligase